MSSEEIRQMYKLTREQMTEFQQAFDFFDANKDGEITYDELKNAMSRCGNDVSELELRMLMKTADKDRSGTITLDEFIEFMRAEKKFKIDKSQAMEQFKVFDKDGDGYITRKEMDSVVHELKLGADFPKDVIDSIFQDADKDKDGRISLEEFMNSMV